MSERAPGGESAGPSPGFTIELYDVLRGQLLDPSVWREQLQRYAQATNLAVVLTDADANPVGPCLNPRPTWLLLNGERPARAGACPFALLPPRPCTCIADALATDRYCLVRDRLGLVHFAVPLRLDGHCVGAVVAGQVFDRYPEQLVLERVARQLDVSPQAAWQRARLEHPVKESALRVYADLLATLADDRLRGHYHKIREAARLAELSRLSEELRQARDELERRVQERTAELREAYASLAEQMRQRRALLQRLETAEEEQRRRISRELHDELGQRLTAGLLELKLLSDAIPEDSGARERLERLQRMMSELGREMHRVAVELRPTALDDLGLPAVLQNYLSEWSARTGTAVELVSSGFESRAPSHAEATLYRIVQEAMNNVAKYAEASRVSVILERRDNHVSLIVEDNGRGFDVDAVLAAGGAHGQLGLLGIQERLELVGGTLTIESGPGGPTTLFARVPISGDSN